MSEALEVRAEIAKIARLLSVEPVEIEFLEQVKPESLVRFREQLVELFFGGEIGGLKRFVGPSRILPAGLIASLTQDSVGPVLTARIAGLVDPKQAVAVVGRLPLEFLADVAVEIDPRRVARIIGGLSEDVIADITAVLSKRREYVAMGRYAAFVSGETLAAVFDRTSDADLLQTAFVMEDKDQLTVALGLLPDKRIRGIIREAGKRRLWAEAIDLLLHLDDEQYARVVDIVAAEGDATLDALVKTAHEDKLWSLVVPIASDMEEPNNVIAAVLRADDSTFEGMIEAIAAYALWDEFYALLEKATKAQRVKTGRRIDRLGLEKTVKPVAALLSG